MKLKRIKDNIVDDKSFRIRVKTTYLMNVKHDGCFFSNSETQKIRSFFLLMRFIDVNKSH